MSEGPPGRALYSAYRRVHYQYMFMATYGGRPAEWELILDRMEPLLEKIESRHPHWKALLEEFWLMPEDELPPLNIRADGT